METVEDTITTTVYNLVNEGFGGNVVGVMTIGETNPDEVLRIMRSVHAELKFLESVGMITGNDTDGWRTL